MPTILYKTFTYEQPIGADYLFNPEASHKQFHHLTVS